MQCGEGADELECARTGIERAPLVGGGIQSVCGRDKLTAAQTAPQQFTVGCRLRGDKPIRSCCIFGELLISRCSAHSLTHVARGRFFGRAALMGLFRRALE
ncbi:hypothetical protein B5F33_05630 [Collinsella sp. An2]|nr:hypothetical protein B5F33_05630 [Collinsella sp. An2]